MIHSTPSRLGARSLSSFLLFLLHLTTTTTVTVYPSFRRLPRSLRFATIGGGTYHLFVSPNAPDPRDVTREYKVPLPWTPPPREELSKELQRSGNGDPQEEFDLLGIGGGATGAGVALDAVTRGLKVALVECNDFSSGAFSPLSHRRTLRDVVWSFARRDVLQID